MKGQDRGIIGVLSRYTPDEVSKPTATCQDGRFLAQI